MRARLLTLSAGLALLLSACGEKPAPATTPAAPAAVGERLVIAPTSIPDLKPISATVTTRRMGEARARIGGTLVKLAVKEGDLVREGQLLAVVADQRLQLETRGYAAQAAAASAQSVRADADLQRIRTLYDKGIYARARLDQAEADAKAAHGALDAARAQQAASAELNAQGAILAPASGRVLHAETPVGSVVTAGQTVVTVTAGEPLLRVEVPEADGQALREGELVRIDPRDIPGAADGRIVQVYPAVTSGLLSADIAAPGLSNDLVGRRVRVLVRIGERAAITVPNRFVSRRYGIDYVRILDAKGHASDVAVQLAPQTDADRVEVLSGLARGDVVVAPRSGS